MRARAGGTCAAPLFQGVVHAGAGSGPGGKKPAQESRDHGEQKGKRHDLPIEPDRADTGERLRQKADTHAQRDGREGKPKQSAGNA